MTKLKDAAKAVLMFEHGGREYRLSPLELDDLAELERWVETLPYDKARRKLVALGDMATPEMRDKILADAEATANAAGISSPYFVNAIGSLEGTAYCLYLCLRAAQPDITRKDASAIITIKTLTAWQERIDKVSGLTVDEDEARPTDGVEPQTPPSTTP